MEAGRGDVPDLREVPLMDLLRRHAPVPRPSLARWEQARGPAPDPARVMRSQRRHECLSGWAWACLVAVPIVVAIGVALMTGG